MCDTEKIIELVKPHSILYDLTHNDYKNFKKKDIIWNTIGLELQQEGDVLKSKWKNLRDSYGKYLQAIHFNTGHTSASANRYKHWQWAKEMEYFRPFMGYSKISSNLTELDASQHLNDSGQNVNELEILKEISESISAHQTESAKSLYCESNQRNSQVNRRKRKKCYQNTSPIDKVIQYLVTRQSKEKLDAIEHIFLGYAKTAKTFSKERQAITKMKIAEIMMQQELEHQREIS